MKYKVGDRIYTDYYKGASDISNLKTATIIVAKNYGEYLIKFDEEGKGNSIDDSFTYSSFKPELNFTTKEKKYWFVVEEDIKTKKVKNTKIAKAFYKNKILQETEEYLTVELV